MSTRLDLKCGRGAISPGEKCTKGTGSRGRTAAKVALGAGIGAAVGAAPDFLEKRRLLKGPTIGGAVAGAALTAGALTLKHRSNVYKQRSANEDYAHQQAMKALDRKKNLSEEEFFDYYNRAYDKALKDPNRPHPEQGGLPHSYSVPVYAASRTRRSRTDAAGRRCGSSTIAANKQCRKGGAFPTRAAIATGLGVAGLAAGTYALQRRRTRILPVNVSVVSPSTPRLRGAPPLARPALPGDRTTRRITGTSPYGLLPPRLRGFGNGRSDNFIQTYAPVLVGNR